MSEISIMADKAQKKEEIKKSLFTESFSLSKMEKKLNMDLKYFNYLLENFVDDSFKNQYVELLESIFENTIALYRECDVTPRVISLALNPEELNENQMIAIYKNFMNEIIKKEYAKPLTEGTLYEKYYDELKRFTKLVIEEGTDVNLDKIKIYMPFEETVNFMVKKVLFPDGASHKIETFFESITPEYYELFEDTAEDIMNKLHQKIRLLSSIIAPKIFDKVVDTEGINASKMAGVTITVDKNFNPSNFRIF
jgi:hypothetical protein